jgi:anti-sigma factor RsiW
VADDHGPHAYHDPLLAASSLDDDLTAGERATTDAAIARCPECRALRDDLRALASATRDLPVPARTRDFTLSVDVAARLASMDAGEPAGSTARLTVEMTATTTSAQHAAHDTILVASLVDQSLPDAERVKAETQIAACGRCAALYADLDALRVATRSMPTPARSRDYTLTPEVAAGLHPRGWRRWVAAIGSSRDVVSRPLAVGLTTLGLAGLLIANVPSFSFGGATSSGALPIANDAAGRATDGTGDVTAGAPESSGGEAAPGAAAGAPSADLAAPGRGSGQPVPIASGRTTVGLPDPAGSPAPDAATDGSTTDGLGVSKSGTGKGAGRQDGPTGPEALTVAGPSSVSPLVVVAGSLLIVGIGLFALRWVARRLSD